MILLLDAIINRPPPTPPPQTQFGGYWRKFLSIQISFFKKWG
jgi:hypothetical protein